MPIIYLVRKDTIPVYVGFTSKSLHKRWKKHLSDAKTKQPCPLLHRAIIKYGPEAFTITEIYSNENEEHTLKVMEPYFIREYKTHVNDGGYNLSLGGNAFNLGRRLSEETKQKMRLAKLGKPRSEETKQKIRLGSLNRHHTDEAKEKIRQANIGKKYPNRVQPKRKYK